MTHEFRLRRRVDFADTDMAGIVHFSNFFRYMEATEHAFFRSLGLTVHRHDDGHLAGWARVHASCDYKRPVRYPEILDIHLVVLEKTERSLRYSFDFRIAASEDGPPQAPVIARGELAVVHVERAPGDEHISAATMPDDVARLVGVSPQSP